MKWAYLFESIQEIGMQHKKEFSGIAIYERLVILSVASYLIKGNDFELLVIIFTIHFHFLGYLIRLMFYK